MIKINKTRIIKKSNWCSNDITQYIEVCKTKKVTDFFIKTDMFLRLARVSSVRIYRCARWVVSSNGELTPEWWSEINHYSNLSSLLHKNIQVFVSTFDTKTKENEDLLFYKRTDFKYTIVGARYKKNTSIYFEKLKILLLENEEYSSLFKRVQQKEREKFRNEEVFNFHFAELCAAASECFKDNAALFVHDNQRIAILRFLEKVGLIPKIGYLPILRKNM